MSRIRSGINSTLMFSLLILLAACGGGGGSGTEESTGQFVEPDLSGSEFDQYVGITSAAELRGDNLWAFVSLALTDSLDSKFAGPTTASMSGRRLVSTVAPTGLGEIPPLLNRTQSSKTSLEEHSNCFVSGTEDVSGTIDDDLTGVLNIVFSNCDDGELILDGEVIVNVIDGAYAAMETAAYYKKVQVTQNGHIYSLSGRIHSSEVPGLSLFNHTADLVVIDYDNAVQLKFENYTFVECDSCYTNNYDEVISGKIYHSDHGLVTVETTQALNHTIDSLESEVLTGQLKFTGNAGSTLLLTFNDISVIQNHVIDEKMHVLQAEFDKDGDQTYETEVNLPAYLVYEPLIYDLADDDNDGMTNGWESLFGLDPSDSTDGEIDSDADGYSNLIEYYYYGNPQDPAIVPVAADLSLEFLPLTDIARAGRPQEVGILITNPNPEYGAYNITVTLEKSTNIQWGAKSGCAWTEVGQNQLTCTIDYLLADDARSVSVEVIGEPEEFVLTSNVASSTVDPNLTNNIDSVTATFNPRLSNIGLLPDYVTSENARNDVAVIGYTHVFDIYLSQWGPDDAHDAVFQMTLPDHVRVESASYTITGASTGVCTVSTEIICNLGTLSHGPSSTKGYIRIEVTGLSEGYGYYTATLTSTSVDNEATDNTIHKRMFVGQSIKPYQDLVDSAVGPLNIDLAAGMYVGGLNCSGKQVNINGDSTPGATVVRTVTPEPGVYESFIMSSDSSISNIYFHGTEYSGIEASAIHVSGSNIVIDNNIFEHNGYNTIGIQGSADNLIIRNNIFRNSQSIHSCNLIRLSGYASYRIENNLVYDTDCSVIILDLWGFSVDASKAVSHVITNNTIVNNAIAISDHVVLDGSVTKIQNNILMNNQLAFDITKPAAIEYAGVPYAAPQILNNLLFDNTVNETSPPDIDLMLFVFGDNINQAAIFTDVSNSDYSQAAGSPSIDAGNNLDAPTIDIESNTRPIDGDLDSVPIVDVGAYEYQP